MYGTQQRFPAPAPARKQTAPARCRFLVAGGRCDRCFISCLRGNGLLCAPRAALKGSVASATKGDAELFKNATVFPQNAPAASVTGSISSAYRFDLVHLDTR